MLSALRSFRFPSHAVAILAFLVILRPAFAQTASEGWNSLQNNDNVKARAAFQAALHRNPADGEALLGLAQVDSLEDRDLVAAKEWRAYYHVAPTSWQAAILWPQFAGYAGMTGQLNLLTEAGRDVLAAKGSPPQLRALAQIAMARAASTQGRTADMEGIFAQLGAIRKWRVIGPFDNASRSGLDKPYPPETGMAFGAQCPGKDDLSLGWHTLGVVSHDGRCLVGAALGSQDASVFYASTAAYSPADQSAMLQFDPVGASRVWLNGNVIFADSVYRAVQDLSCDMFRIPIKLHAGWNTLLVKLADEHGRSALLARLTAADGRALAGIRIDPTQAVAQKAGTRPATAGPAQPGLVQLASAHSDSVEGAVALAEYERWTGGVQAAIDLVRHALGAHADCGWLHQELAELLDEDEQMDDARAERDLARKANPRLVGSELAYLQEQREALGPQETAKRLKALLAVSPDSARTHSALSTTYMAAKMTQDSLREARISARCDPGPTAWDTLVTKLKDSDRKAEAQTVLATALQSFPNDEDLLAHRAQILAEDGKTAAALAAYEHVIAVAAPLPEYQSEIASLYVASADWKRAAQSLALLRQQTPQDADACAELGDALASLGRKAEAIALYREAIRLDPAEVKLRDKLQITSGERPILDLAPATPSQQILAEAKSAKPEGASATVFLDEGREVVYPDFAVVMRAHMILKVFDAAGVKRHQSFPLAREESTARVTLESARVIKPDGKVQDITQSGAGGEEEAQFPSLAPGDVIDISYRVENYRRGALSRQFWMNWTFNQPDAPVKLSRYVLITPGALTFESRKHGAVPDPSVRDEKGWRIREWRATALPAPKLTATSPGQLDCATWLDISTVPGWRDIVRWYLDISRSRCEPDAAVRAKAAELTKGATTEDAKIHAIVSFVRAIQYQTTPFRLSAYVPTEPKQVLRERYADCKDKAALLTALLRAVGIQSRMVLLCIRAEGLTSYLPSPRFSHAIADVQTGHGPLWIDATADTLQYGGLPLQDQGVSALVIDDSTADLAPSPKLPVDSNAFTESYDLTLSESGQIRASVILEGLGNSASLLRTVFHAIPETQRDEGIRGIAGALVPNCACEGGKVENLQDADKPFRIGFGLTAEHYANSAGNLLLVPIPWSATRGSLARQIEAAGSGQDCELSSGMGIEVSSVHLKLPAGYSVQDLPADVHGEDAWMSYTLSYHVEGNMLVVRCERRLAAMRVPASGVPQLLTDLRALETAAARQIVLKK
jgi:tetratricopeptide (TPR) repeat protein